MNCFFVYILASKKNGVLYVGVTNDLQRRVLEHKNGAGDGFTRQYHVNKLVYYERFGDVDTAIKREKNMKAWKRAWKIRLIEEGNPDWDDISDGRLG